MGHETDGDINRSWCTYDNFQKIGKGTERPGNKKTSENHPDNSIIKIDQNTEKT